MSHAQESIIELAGQKIAAKIWGPGKGSPILALHGWLDNAASFDRLAPLLPQPLVAIDFPGHGLSDHKPLGSFIHIIDFVVNAILVANHFQWEKFVLLGHSLGAAISSIIAGTIPDRILGVALIDGLAPFSTPASQTPQQLRLFVDEMLIKPNKKAPIYATQEEAVQARLKNNKMNPESAWILVKRGTKQLDNGQWTWRTDPRLLMPSAIQLTEEQVIAFLAAIKSPISIIRPDAGFPFPQEIVQNQLKALPHVNIFRLPGHHHIHLDAPEIVATCLAPFLQNLAK